MSSDNVLIAIDEGLAELLVAGHVERAGPDANGEQTYRITESGRQYLEQDLLPRMGVTPDAMKAQFDSIFGGKDGAK